MKNLIIVLLVGVLFVNSATLALAEDNNCNQQAAFSLYLKIKELSFKFIPKDKNSIKASNTKGVSKGALSKKAKDSTDKANKTIALVNNIENKLQKLKNLSTGRYVGVAQIQKTTKEVCNDVVRYLNNDGNYNEIDKSSLINEISSIEKQILRKDCNEIQLLMKTKSSYMERDQNIPTMKIEEKSQDRMAEKIGIAVGGGGSKLDKQFIEKTAKSETTVIQNSLSSGNNDLKDRVDSVKNEIIKRDSLGNDQLLARLEKKGTEINSRLDSSIKKDSIQYKVINSTLYNNFEYVRRCIYDIDNKNQEQIGQLSDIQSLLREIKNNTTIVEEYPIVAITVLGNYLIDFESGSLIAKSSIGGEVLVYASRIGKAPPKKDTVALQLKDTTQWDWGFYINYISPRYTIRASNESLESSIMCVGGMGSRRILNYLRINGMIGYLNAKAALYANSGNELAKWNGLHFKIEASLSRFSYKYPLELCCSLSYYYTEEHNYTYSDKNSTALKLNKFNFALGLRYNF